MFRFGKLRLSLSEVAKKEPSAVRMQRRCIQARSFLPGLASRSAGTPSATAQVAGGGKHHVQPQAHTIDSGAEDVSTFVGLVYITLYSNTILDPSRTAAGLGRSSVASSPQDRCIWATTWAPSASGYSCRMPAKPCDRSELHNTKNSRKNTSN